MNHYTIRATNLPVIVKLIAEKLKCSELDALDRFYNSAVGKCFSDDETGLYGQSALYVYGLFLEEISYNKK